MDDLRPTPPLPPPQLFPHQIMKEQQDRSNNNSNNSQIKITKCHPLSSSSQVGGSPLLILSQDNDDNGPLLPIQHDPSRCGATFPPPQEEEEEEEEEERLIVPLQRTKNSLSVTQSPQHDEGKKKKKVVVDRLHRLDVLWRTEGGDEGSICCSDDFLPQEEEDEDDEAMRRSASASHTAEQKKLWDTYWDEVEEGPHQEDPNNRNNNNDSLLVSSSKRKKPSSDENKRSSSPGRDPSPQNDRRPGEERLSQRPSIAWPWHSGLYEMGIRFHEPRFRNNFSLKIILLKALQWGLVTAWVFISAQYVPFLRQNVKDLLWTVYFAAVIFLIIFLTVRSTNMATSKSAYVIFFSYLVCMSHIASLLYIHHDIAGIPVTLLSLCFTYTFTGLIIGITKVPVDASTVYYPLFCLGFVSSVMGFWTTLVLRREVFGRDRLRRMVTLWLPSWIMSELICIIEMMEIQALLEGTRTPLEADDWPLATVFLL